MLTAMDEEHGSFELVERDGLARICTLSTRHGKIETPALLPVINPKFGYVTPTELKETFGADGVITNSYLIKKSMTEEEISRGVHSMLGFDGPIMTDSGSFQLFTYGDIDVAPDEIIRFQEKLGVDIGTILDIPSPPDSARGKAEDDLKKTLQRAREAVGLKEKMLLALTVQGSTYVDLRKLCAEEMAGICRDYYAIGGVVPLLESYRFRELAEIILAVKKSLPHGTPVHLFGAGHPMVFPLAALLGCDLFDSASYAKYARNGRMMFGDGTRHLDELKWLPCSCPVCSTHTASELQESSDRENLISRHNLYVCFGMIKTVRQAIKDGTLWELVQMQARSHPAMLEALKALKPHVDYLCRYEPVSRRRFFYLGSDSINQPCVVRFKKRVLERYSQPAVPLVVCLPPSPPQYSERYSDVIKCVLDHTDARFVVESIFGPVPIELDGIYPVCQSVVPDEEYLDAETINEKISAMKRFSHRLKSDISVCWDGRQSLDFIMSAVEKRQSHADIDLLRARAVADYQFGCGAADALFRGKIEIMKSKKTGKIRTVSSDGKHILSLRAEDGLYTLKYEGGARLHRCFSKPALRVVVKQDAIPFVTQGKSVFTRFVSDCDPEICPTDEVLITDSEDNLLAVGRTLLTRDEMLSFRRGVAVHVRDVLKH